MKRLFFAGMTIAICLILAPSMVLGAVIHVPGDAATIQAGIDSAVNGDTVLVADGTYTGAGNRDIDFLGKAITVISENGPETCVLDSEGSDIDPHRGFNLATACLGRAILEGFTITGGAGVNLGGGIYCRAGAVSEIINCRIIGNTAIDSGGGIFSSGQTLKVADCIVSSNTANEAGGMKFSSSEVEIIHTEISSNTVSDSGGGVSFSSDTAFEMIDCAITGNSSSGHGGGIVANGSQGIIITSEISGNTCGNEGGGIMSGFGIILDLHHCTLTDNMATSGGAIYSGSVLNMFNSTVNGNMAEWGGGIHISSGPGTLISGCTIVSNYAGTTGGGGYGINAVIDIENSIFRNNDSPEGSAFSIVYSSSLDIRYSNVQAGLDGIFVHPWSTLNWGDGMLDADPLFVPGPEGAYYLSHLAAGQPEDSPCIDAGQYPAAVTCIEMSWGPVCLDEMTLRTDEIPDGSIADMGRHYFPAAYTTPTPPPTETPGPPSATPATPTHTPVPTYTAPPGDNLILTDVSGCTGDLVTVDLRMANEFTSVDAITIDLSFDPEILTCIGCEVGDLDPGWTMFGCGGNHPLGEIRVGGFTFGSGIPPGSNGTITRLFFDVNCPECQDFDVSDLVITEVHDDVEDFNTVNGMFIYYCGDPPMPTLTPSPTPTSTPTATPTFTALPGDTLMLTDATGCTGDLVAVDLRMANEITPVDAMTVYLSYDPEILTYISCETGDLDPGWFLFNCGSSPAPGEIRLGGFCSGTSIPSGSNGIISRLYFDVNCPECQDFDLSDLTITTVFDDVATFDTFDGVFTYYCDGPPGPTSTPVPTMPTSTPSLTPTVSPTATETPIWVPVISVSPSGGSHNVPVNTDLTVTVDAAVDPGTVNSSTFMVHSGFQAPVTGTFDTDMNTFSFDPSFDFHPGELIQATITDGVEADGNPVHPYIWGFRTEVTGGPGNFVSTELTEGGRVVVLGDLDGDHDLDAFIGNCTPWEGLIMINDGSGTFTDSGQTLGSYDSREAALGDLDNDGDLDIFYASYDEGYRIWLNDGSGIFTESAQTFEGRGTFSLGDLDGDGDLDAFFARSNGNRVLFNDGNGYYFDSGQSLGSNASKGVSLGDVDNDGDLDAMVINLDQGNRVWLNGGRGTFVDSGQSLGNNNRRDISMGDLDGDGDLDAFVANYDNGNRIWINNGAGNFMDSGQLIGDYPSTSISLGDLDGDGDLDAFVTNGGQNNRYWQNDGTGIFTDSGQLLANDLSLDSALGDLDGDGDLDAFVVNTDENIIWFYQINPTPTSTPTSTPTPTATGTSTPTPHELDITPTPTDTPTPLPTATLPPTETPEVTPTPVRIDPEIDIRMPAHYFTPGDPCSCIVSLTYPGQEPLSDLRLFVCLDIGGTMLFAPSFQGFDYYEVETVHPFMTFYVFDTFTWPDHVGTARDVTWYAFMTNPDFSEIIGNVDSWAFGWGMGPVFKYPLPVE